ncbi:MAG: glycosyltransferase [Oleiphilaceae bacterium]|nr:glycosyltransferase [Oleiphilaceae bacterium]
MHPETTETETAVPSRGGRVWLTWEIQRRNRSMSRALNARLHELISHRPRLTRYPVLLLRTLAVLHREKPLTVFAQNPSIVLSLMVVLLKPLWRYKAIIDAHNSGLYPLEGRNGLLNTLARFIVRHADRVIVTNQALADTCLAWGGHPVVVPDPLPQFPGLSHGADNRPVRGPVPDSASGGPLNLLCICTWSEDEPIEAVIRAASAFSPQVMRLGITGRPRGSIARDLSRDGVPGSVQLLGFLSETDYQQALSSADGVIVLTRREHCLNCGAYEAVALEKPGLLSDSAALRTHFRQGFVFVDNSPQGIEAGLHRLLQGYHEFSRQVAALKSELTQSNRERIASLEMKLP